MKRQIIVHSVDVINCPFYYSGDYFSCSGFNARCSNDNFKDCPYKELIRLKQENKELEAKYLLALDTCVSYMELIEELETLND